ncbi:Cytochrome P450 3A56, partial [Fragariocoptes setiger]
TNIDSRFHIYHHNHHNHHHHYNCTSQSCQSIKVSRSILIASNDKYVHQSSIQLSGDMLDKSLMEDNHLANMLFATRTAIQWSAYTSYLMQWPTITIVALTLIHIYYKYKFNYWARQGIKTPPPIPWFGTALYPLLVPKPELELQFHKNYGKLYGLYDGFLGTNPTLVCGHPEAIKQVTIKHFHSFTNRRRPMTYRSIRYRALTYMMDDEWKQLRCLLAPIFTSNKLKRMFELMKRCTSHLQTAIASHNGQEVDLKKLFAVYTVDVISACCFSMDLKDYRHPDSQILSSARRFFEVSKFKMAFGMTLPRHLLRAIGFDINDTTSIDFFEKFATDIINKRRQLLAKQVNANSAKPDDFLQILLDAVNSDSTMKSYYAKSTTSTTINQIHQQQNKMNNNNSSDKLVRQISIADNSIPVFESYRMPYYQDQEQNEQTHVHDRHVQSKDQDQVNVTTTTATSTTTTTTTQQQQQQVDKYKLGDLEILAQTMLFFAVGHETTATLLSSCGFFLALNPPMQARLYAEVHKAFQEGKGDISYDKLLELEYLDAFVCESLRYFTPTLNFDREASEDVDIVVN